MTLCSSQAQQAGFGPRPSFQDTACFVNKIRDTDRRTQKERARAGAPALFTQTAGVITNVFFHTAFFLPPACWAPPLPRPSPLHPPAPLPVSSSSCLLPSIPLLHTPSVFVSLRRSFSPHVPHFYDSLVSLRQINPGIYCQAGVVYSITVPRLEKKNHLKLLTALTHSAGWSLRSIQTVRCSCECVCVLFLQYIINLPCNSDMTILWGKKWQNSVTVFFHTTNSNLNRKPIFVNPLYLFASIIKIIVIYKHNTWDIH